VPTHWEIKRAKSILQCIDQRSRTGKEELLTVSSARGVIPRKTAIVTMFKAESYVGYKLCWPGDLVINSLWAWSGGLGVSSHHGIISSAYGVYRIRHDAPMIPAFVHEVVRSSSFNWELQVRSKGIWISRLQLTDVSFLDAPMHIPPPAEQAAIVRFLDWANGRLERAIGAKRKVIALLTEQKQAIIHRAVTRGLDPSVPLKSSGISWLGEIPAHWEVLPLRRLLAERKEKNDPIKTNNILSLSLHAGVIPYADKKPGGNKAKEDLSAYMLAYPGDIVLNSMNVVVGSVGLSQYFGAVSPVYYMLYPRHADDLVEFFDALFQSSAFQRSLFGLGNGIVVIQSKSSGQLNTIRMRIPMTKLRRVQVPYLGPKGQAAIVEYVARVTSTFNNAIDKVRREADLLREYRTRLVADVVTGKLDVREAAACLPEEAAPDTAEDDTDLSGETESADEEAAV
jgi:type I restriction enzyme, S subunit